MDERQYIVDKTYEGSRLDIYISKKIKGKSRSYIQNLINDNNVKVNNSIKKCNYKVKFNDIVQVIIPDKVKQQINPEPIPLNILYEDEDIIIINKPQGMVVHPSKGVYSGTLVNALLNYSNNLSTINGSMRPGIVHRIDKNTSGLLVVAKNDMSYIKLAKQFENHSISRIYIALVEGVIKENKGTIDEPLKRHPINRIKFAVVEGGRKAVTHYKVIERFKKNTLVECSLETGRTHQIRVHMAHINHPLVGDTTYGCKKQKFNLKGQMLHAKKLGFIHPTKGEYMEFDTNIPQYFNEVIDILRTQ